MKKQRFEVRNECDGYGLDLTGIDEDDYVLLIELYTPVGEKEDLEGMMLLEATAVDALIADLVEFREGMRSRKD